jgi:hypothetical protein
VALCAALGAGTLGTVATAPAAAATSGVPGTYVATTPTRVLDTRTGAYGNRKGAVRAGGATNVRVTGGSGVPSTAAAVAVTITVVAATHSGGITASTYGVSSRPHVTNVQFSAGHAATDLAVVRLTSGRIKLWNASDGRVQLVADVTGYYVGGTPSVDGALHLGAAKRVVDTRTGRNGFHHGPLKAGSTMSPNLRTLADLPRNAGAVAATVTVFDPTRSGSLIAYATHTTRPSAPLLDFTAGRAVSQYAVLPISDVQGLSLRNASSGSVQVVIDVLGYQTDGPPAVAHGQQVVTANRIYRDGTLPGHSSDVVHVLGHGGVPKSGVAAVAVAVRVSNAGRAGRIVAGKGRAPIVASFGARRRTAGHAIVRVVNGAIRLRNTSSRALTLEVDVVGYVPSTSLTTPTAVSVARYPNDLMGEVFNDENLMDAYGPSDAADHATFVLFDLGAQTIHAPLSAAHPGVAIALTDPVVRIRYADLVNVFEEYIAKFSEGSGAPSHMTLAIGTNNDGDWSSYGARARGRQFANLLIDPLRKYASDNSLPVTVVGANDIEANFGTHKASDVIAWEDAYFANTDAELVYNGALNDCPTVFGSTASCAYGWTQKQYASLTRHVESRRNRTRVLPQIYFPVQAVQWANIVAHAGGPLRFVGSLTQQGADASTYTPAQGWAALVRALQWRIATPDVPRTVDIKPDA